MVEVDRQVTTVALAASELFNQARIEEPHPLHPAQGEVVRYVREMQNADFALAHALDAARPHGLPEAERALLLRKRASADGAIARQVMLAGRRIGPSRQESLETLNAIFKLGHAPEPPLNGEARGYFVTPTLFAPLDSFGRFMARLYMPWMGKRFDAQSSRGDNVFAPSVRFAGRLFWPTFSGYEPYRDGLVTAFEFSTYTGPGVHDPEISTLKLDYDNRFNPSFLVRSVLDEVVQITGNYYLGKAFLHWKGGYRLAAFFALRREEVGG
jgi:hypothetical protein